MKAPLTTADYALIVSLCSVAISLAGFVWNVWSKFVYPKAKLKVSYAAVCIARAGDVPDERPMYVCIGVTNFGPTEVTVQAAFAVIRAGPFKRQFGMLTPIHDVLNDPEIGIGPFGGGLPKPLKVGEHFSLYFPYSADTWSRANTAQVGVYDIFGRRHRASWKQIKRVKTELDKAFIDQPFTHIVGQGE